MTTTLPQQIIADLAHGHILARCLHAAAELGIADVLDDEPLTAAELAARSGVNADALERVLRVLATCGVFAKAADGYVHTAASRLLRGDHPRSLRAYVRMTGMGPMWNSFTAFADVVRTGQPSSGWTALIEHFKSHSDDSALFDEAMIAKSIGAAEAVLRAYDFTRFATIVDVGGGRGHLLRAILDALPSAEGVLFDLPHVAAEAAKTNASPRMRVEAGSFFDDPLPRADAYLLMEVLHDWTDADAARILSSVRRAAPRGSRLLIIETLVRDSERRYPGQTIDLVMLAVTGGRERTRQEYERLLDTAGFKLERVIETETRFVIVEAAAS